MTSKSVMDIRRRAFSLTARGQVHSLLGTDCTSMARALARSGGYDEAINGSPVAYN